MRLSRMVPAFVVACLACVPASAQRAGIEFLNERLRLPESERYDAGAYIESGVGLGFGVDKRLTYLAGNYEESAQRFELAVRKFKYKAEIWVYLARSYFYMKSPAQAKETLNRAQTLMPDLSEELWQPMLSGLEYEIRQRAAQQQAQVDFYSTGQEDVLSLFRLYLFLDDEQAATKLVSVARDRARMMRQKALMVSGSSRRAQVDEAQRWDDLGVSLTGELQGAGIEVPPAPMDSTAMEDPDKAERIRVLQLRVDFYKAEEADFIDLFQAYLDAGDTERARSVLGSLRRQLADTQVRASVAPTADAQAQAEETMANLQTLVDDFLARLPAEESPATAPSAAP